MKKKYYEPEFEVLKLDLSNVILSSGGNPEDGLGEDIENND